MDIVFTLPPALWIGLIVSTILPLLTGLVTTRVTSSGIKATILAALSAVTGLGTELLATVQSGGTYDFGIGLLLAIPAFLTGVGLHFGFWKPTHVAEKLQSVSFTPKHRAEGA